MSNTATRNKKARPTKRNVLVSMDSNCHLIFRHHGSLDNHIANSRRDDAIKRRTAPFEQSDASVGSLKSNLNHP